MYIEQTTIHAVVRSLEGRNAVVETEQGGCGRCHEKGGCGGQQLTQMFCNGKKTFQVDNAIGAAVGDRVTIAVAPGSVRRTANLAYVLPLIATIVGAALGASFGGDLSAIMGGAVALIISFLYVIFRSQGDTGNFSGRPHIISR